MHWNYQSFFSYYLQPKKKGSSTTSFTKQISFLLFVTMFEFRIQKTKKGKVWKVVRHTVTMKTWSKRIEDRIHKCKLLHLQAEKADTGSDCVLKEEREICKWLHEMGCPIIANPDFLKAGEGVWWKEMEDKRDQTCTTSVPVI